MMLTDPDKVITEFRRYPRLAFGHYPTPLEELPRLRAALGKNAPRLFIKRDDYTGPGFGGNKVRKLEYYLAQAINDGAEVVITMGGEKSNHCRVTAAMCARLGLRCVLVQNPAAIRYPDLTPANQYLDELYGAEIHRVSNRQERIDTAQTITDKLRNDGLNVCEIPLGASTPLGALGFIVAMEEASTQLRAMNLTITHLFHSSSSGGTQAGLVAGNQLFNVTTQIMGVSPDDPSSSIGGEVSRIIRGIGELLNTSFNDEVTVSDEFVGEGYGIPTEAANEAISLLARTEGITIDPVYTSKAMAALLDWIRNGKLTPQDNVLFWHTGGQLALFYAPTR